MPRAFVHISLPTGEIRQMIRFLLLSFALIGLNQELRAEEDWTLKRDREGIKVYTRSIEGSAHKAVRAEMIVQASINALVGLTMDTSACPKWAALCKRAEIVRRESETEFYVYTFNDLPWPVKDRDVVAKVTWSADPVGSVSMTAKLVTGLVPEKNKVVRLSDGITRWAFSPTQNGETRVVSYVHLDPGGSIPAWLTNTLLIDSPHQTLQGMRILVQTGQYDDARFAFIGAAATNQ